MYAALLARFQPHLLGTILLVLVICSWILGTFVLVLVFILLTAIEVFRGVIWTAGFRFLFMLEISMGFILRARG